MLYFRILQIHKQTNTQAYRDTTTHTKTREQTSTHSINTPQNYRNMPRHSNIQHKHTRAQRKQHKQRKERTQTHINACKRKIFAQAHTNTHTRTYTSTANPRARVHGSTRVVPGGARLRATDTRALLVLHVRGSTLRALGRARARRGTETLFVSLGSDRSRESGSGTFLEASEVGVLFGEPLFKDPGVSKTSGEAHEAPLKGFGTRSAPFYRPQATL